MMEKNYQHWRLAQKETILWLYFDREKESTNSLNQQALMELSEILHILAENKSVQGLIITSGKASSFIVGADVRAIQQLKTPKEILEFIQQGQATFAQLASLKVPTVALINGICLGGGLELALACTYRVLVDELKTRLGLPEVKLGIHPGWGGTVRLPRLLGAPRALEWMLTGRTMDPVTALKQGLVNCVVPKRQSERAALYYINARFHGDSIFKSYWKSITNSSWMRPFIASVFHRHLAAKVNASHYPAPYKIIDLWQRYGVSNKGFLQEAESLSQLAITPTAQHLIRVFFLQERLKKLGKKNIISFKRVHVIGAGTMGGDIAAWCALQGLQVTLQDREAKYLAPAMTRAYALFKKRLKTPRLVQAAMDRLLPDLAGYGVRHADLVIEAVFEDLATKQTIFRQLEGQVKPDAILATNTSSIVLEQIQQGLKQPDHLIGLHFFNPVAKMPLVEVVQSAENSPAVLEKALAFVHCINRLPLPVKSSPGFLVNRLLMPYLVQAVSLLEKGIPAPVIDQAAVDFGMPMGPLELADTVGIDICLAVARILRSFLTDPIPEGLEKMVANKALGRKTGQGFYRYKKGKPVKEKIPTDYRAPADIIDSLIQPMLKEARACLTERVVTDEDLIDAGLIFGVGFAPFRGGLMQYAKEENK